MTKNLYTEDAGRNSRFDSWDASGIRERNQGRAQGNHGSAAHGQDTAGRIGWITQYAGQQIEDNLSRLEKRDSSCRRWSAYQDLR
jgi:hypothetical protein